MEGEHCRLIPREELVFFGLPEPLPLRKESSSFSPPTTNLLNTTIQHSETSPKPMYGDEEYV